MTEIATREVHGLAVSENFLATYPALALDDDTLELIQAALGEDRELGIRDLVQLTVPSGPKPGTRVYWSVPDAAPVEKLEGAMVLFAPNRKYWAKKLGEDGASDKVPPDCASVDGITPAPGGRYSLTGEYAADNPGGLCKGCPVSQGDADPLCRDMRWLFLLRDGEPLPTVINAPPMSRKPLKDFYLSLATKGIPYWGVRTSYALVQKTRNGNDYAEIVPSLVLDSDGNPMRYSPDETKLAKKFQTDIKGWIANSDSPLASNASTADTGIDLTVED